MHSDTSFSRTGPRLARRADKLSDSELSLIDRDDVLPDNLPIRQARQLHNLVSQARLTRVAASIRRGFTPRSW
jgi:hypothetical protein